MSKTLKIVFSWLLVSSALAVHSQKLRFKQITGEDGLSTNFVRTVMQDDKGFMWFGTQDGLNRYDGYEMKVYRSDPADTTSLTSSDIVSLLQVRPDLFLVGTREGLNYFNPVTGRFSQVRRPGILGRARVNALLYLDTGFVLAGTDGGLAVVDLERDSAAALLFDGATAVVKSLARIDGSVFVGTAGRGLWRLGNNNTLHMAPLTVPEFMEIERQDGLKAITTIRQYGDMMYLGTSSAGIFKVDRSLEVQAHISFSGLNENSNAIRDFIIRNNNIYAATAYGAVVYHLISGKTDFYTRQETAQSLNSNPCNSIFSDKQNNVWIGTDLGGVNVAMHRSLRFPLSTYNFETTFDNVYSFAEDRKNTVIVGGVKSLRELNFESGQVTDHSAVLGNGTARCILRESEHVLWIGTWGNGLYRYDRRTRKAKNLLGDSQGGTILTLFRDNGFLYAGSAGAGLFRINLTTLEVTAFGEREGLPSLSINCIFRDSKGRIWLGTYDGGLARLAGLDSLATLRVERVYSKRGKAGDIASNVIFGVNEAANGSIWAATSAGLSKLLPDNTFQNFYQKDGLPNTYLYSLLKDSTGHFWLSSNAGLIRFNPMLAHGQITFKSYGLKDGLINTGYNMGAALSSSTGLMYFGGSKGFNVFRPTAIKDNFHPPPVYVVSYKVGGKEVQTDTAIAYKRHLRLDWSENSLQFELAALDYTDPQKNLYSYILEGYDNDWSEPGNVRYVSYTELPGGDYVFKVKAANNDGIWNERPCQVYITVVPPFWDTTAFYVLVTILGLGAVYGFTVIRTRAIRRENVMLEHKVAERTKELEARNRDITSSIQYAKRIQEAILPSRDQIFRKLKKVFILYRPKDIVSGDFYWFAEKDGVKIFAVVDCTGHGVPGAFMSMIGHNLLDQVVTENGITDPGEILNQLHRGVMHALRQGHNEVSTNDGMDVSLIAINDASREVRWAGANRPLILIDSGGAFSKYDGNKDPVGGAQAHLDRVFTTHVIKVKVATMAYLFSDGYADQFGGNKGKKFMVKRFHQLLTTIHKHGAEEQRIALEEHFERWRQNHEQVDDVLIVGIEI